MGKKYWTQFRYYEEMFEKCSDISKEKLKSGITRYTQMNSLWFIMINSNKSVRCLKTFNQKWSFLMRLASKLHQYIVTNFTVLKRKAAHIYFILYSLVQTKINIGCSWSLGSQTALHLKQPCLYNGNRCMGSASHLLIFV